MRIYISGGCKNGKSHYALKRALELPAPRHYIATMIPRDGEDIDRIDRHRVRRDGLDIKTLERGTDIELCADEVEPGSTLLIDSVTALLDNEMFSDIASPNCEAPKKIMRGLDALSRRAGHVIFISDYIYSNARSGNDWTQIYLRGLGAIDRHIAAQCDEVVELIAGCPHRYPRTEEKPVDGMHLIFGGSHQGKVAYAESLYGVPAVDISAADDDHPKDLSHRVFYGVEHLAIHLMKRNIDPIEYLALRRHEWANSTIILHDITRDTPPRNDDELLFVEAASRMQHGLARHADRVTQLYLGVPKTIKG